MRVLGRRAAEVPTQFQLPAQVGANHDSSRWSMGSVLFLAAFAVMNGPKAFGEPAETVAAAQCAD
jgi:hypothetical protein